MEYQKIINLWYNENNQLPTISQKMLWHSFTISELERDYYHQMFNVRVAKRLNTPNLLFKNKNLVIAQEY